MAAATLPYPLLSTTSRRHAYDPPRRYVVTSRFAGVHVRRHLVGKAKRWVAALPCIANGGTAPVVEQDDEEELWVLSHIKSSFNDILVVDSPKSRFLLLDSTHNIHSIFNKEERFTGSYWDDFATLPAIIPRGPIALLGLGAGTAARLMLDIWPSLHLKGWEIDEILVDKAREYFGLSDLEKPTDQGGFLSVNIGDALSPTANVEDGFAGIIVDLFGDGKVLPELNQVETWLEVQTRLMPSGRIMVNCGGSNATCDDELAALTLSSDCSWMKNTAIRALGEAFPGKLWWKRCGGNYLAFTGTEPDFDSWLTVVPVELSSNVMEWKRL